MTEEEAKGKWCPLSRAAYTPNGFASISANRMVDKSMQSAGCNCIGSACMAWRFDELAVTGTDKIAAIKAYREVHGGTLVEAKKLLDAGKLPVSRSGHCGLAGKP